MTHFASRLTTATPSLWLQHLAMNVSRSKFGAKHDQPDERLVFKLDSAGTPRLYRM